VSTIKAELKEAVAQSGRDFYAKGLTWGRDAGDTSIRDPQTGYIYILPMPSSTLKIDTWASITPAQAIADSIDEAAALKTVLSQKV
jgi:hypothetical protein